VFTTLAVPLDFHVVLAAVLWRKIICLLPGNWRTNTSALAEGWNGVGKWRCLVFRGILLFGVNPEAL
jgi:hypothetical protein